ncbi:hypothetical protein BD779DRAFT_1378640, partial [Infundibulicybe gibba]
MLKTMKKYKVAFAPASLSKELRGQMPMWHHISEPDSGRHRNNDAWAKCQRTTHHIRTVKDMVDFIQKVMPPCHKMRKNCACESCKDERMSGCKNPPKCRRKGVATLMTLPPKWNPMADLDTIEPVASEQPEEIRGNRDEIVCFNKDITTRGSLKEGFRVFTDPTVRSIHPAV